MLTHTNRRFIAEDITDLFNRPLLQHYKDHMPDNLPDNILNQYAQFLAILLTVGCWARCQGIIITNPERNRTIGFWNDSLTPDCDTRYQVYCVSLVQQIDNHRQIATINPFNTVTVNTHTQGNQREEQASIQRLANLILNALHNNPENEAPSVIRQSHTIHLISDYDNE